MIHSNDEERNKRENGVVEDPLEPVSTNGVHQEGALGIKMNDVQFPLALVLATSFVLLLAVMTWEGNMKSRGYAIAVPVLSLVLSLTGILLTVFRENLYAIYGHYLVNILFMWNFTGACFLTFSSPFTTTGNGYFAAWGCVVTSAMAMGFTGDAFRAKVEGLGPLLGLCASAAIVVIALIDYVGAKAQHFSRHESIYAMVVSVFTIILVLGVMSYQKRNGDLGGNKTFVIAKFSSLALFALLWLILACLVTFSGPFNTTGNGYFASWAGAACAWFATFAAWKEMGVSTESVTQFLTPASNSDGPTGLSATIT